MSKSRSFKLFCLLLLSACTLPKNAFAFISPDTIQVVASSIGPGILYALIIIFASIFSFLKRLKTKLSEKRLLVSSLAALAVLVLTIGWKYYDIRFRTHISYRCCHKDACDVEYCAELLGRNGSRLSYQEFRRERYVDLNTIDPQSYGSFQKLGIQDFLPIRLIGDTAPFAARFGMNPPEMKRILERFDKNKKLLLYFTYYDFSSLLAYSAFTLGYDAYYTALYPLTSDDLLDYSIPREKLIQGLPNIQVFKDKENPD